MTPWVVDAKDISDREVESFRSSLMLGNAQIVDFLSSRNKIEMLIVAPKGYGKTLLLKAKRQMVQNERQYAHILPKNHLVDKPGGVPNIAKKDDNYRQSDEYWKILWMIAISMVFLKAEKVAVSELSQKTTTLWKDDAFDLACDFFTQLLQFDSGEYEKSKNDCMNRLIPHLRQIRESACLFIDNVDEFFEDVLRQSQADLGQDAIPRSFWYKAQIGVALAAREIHALNNHLKIFVSIRQEAFEAFANNSPIGLQLKGSSIEVKYSYTDLNRIIEKNIDSENPDSLPNPGKKDPVCRFLVNGDGIISHDNTDDQENLKDFWLRHTLRRPRDIAAIGRKLSNVDKDQRTLKKAMKVIVGESAALVRSYLAESVPHLEYFDPDILMPLIQKNCYSRVELSELAEAYTAQYSQQHLVGGTGTLHPFCHLYKLGLLGYVRPERGGRGYTQYFSKPGEQALGGVSVLPKAETYLIHPILDEWLTRLLPEYIQNMNQLNVIGHKHSWRPSNHVHYVLKGDVERYSRFNRNQDRRLQFDAEFDRICHAHAKGLRYAATSGGDSVTLADENPRKVILCAQNINTAISQTVFKAAVRFGGACGRVDFVPGQNGETLSSGTTFNDAARIEPHVKAGRIYVTKAFVEQATHTLQQKPFKTRRVSANQMPKLPYENRQFNFSKPDSPEPPVWKEVYAVSVVTDA